LLVSPRQLATGKRIGIGLVKTLSEAPLLLTDDVIEARRERCLEDVQERGQGWLAEAAASLIMDPIVLAGDAELGYVNGQHRTRAMLDQRCRFAIAQIYVTQDERMSRSRELFV
jgi:hypothetical protein